MPTQPLSRSQSRTFALMFLVVVLLLATLATALIYRGWHDPFLQGHVEKMETLNGVQR